MPTDGQQVSETAMAIRCKHCGKAVSEGIEQDCFGSKDGMHDWAEPAEPVAVPPAPPEIGMTPYAKLRLLTRPELYERIWALEGKRA